MEPLIVLAVTFVLLWVIFILPQQRRVRAHQALVASVQPGDQVILSAGIYGRIVDLGPEDMSLEVAPGVQLRVARQAVLRLIEDTTADDATRPGPDDRLPGEPYTDDRGPAAPGPNVT
jgi:preprotein translocase subunit YajC